MNAPKPRRFDWRHLLAVLLAALGSGLAIGVAVDDDGVTVRIGRPVVVSVPVPVPTPPAAVAVDGPDADTKRDDAIILDPAAQAQAGAILARDQTDPGGGDLRGPDDGKAGVFPSPLAAPEWPGCRTAFVRNFSSRNGVRPSIIVWHQTVSRENGLSSQNALTALANSPAAQVSWHFLIGRSNGLCTYTVPTSLKAWTEAGANSYGVGIEVEAYGDEPTYVTGAGKARLLAVTARIGRLYGIPMRRGIVRDCRVIRSGIVEHKDLDQVTTCAGGHADVNLPGTGELIDELGRGAGAPCKTATTCPRALELRAKHRRTHQRFNKLDCKHQFHKSRYCVTLHNRNRAVHIAAKRDGVSLAGTYR